MEPNVSRQPFVTGLMPNRWVVVMQDMEGVAGRAIPGGRTVRDFYHGIRLAVEAAPANTQNVTLQIQDSDDGITWTQRYKHPTALRPGGQLSFDQVHVQARFRVLAYSTGVGVIKTYLLPPEAQASPDYLREPGHDGEPMLVCASFCEQDCETGTETSG